MDDHPIRILLVEDNPADAGLMKAALAEAAGRFVVTHVESMHEALGRLRSDVFDAVLLDLSLPDTTGIDTVAQAIAIAPHLPILVLTGMADDATAIEAVRKGAQDFLIKGCADHDLLVRAIHYAMERKRAEEEIRTLNAELERRVIERTAVAEQRANQLRALASELTLTEERQRRHLAAILHDHLQQLLVAARLKLSLLSRRMHDHEHQPMLKQVDQLLHDSIEASRSLTVELSPPVLYDGGLAMALEWLARQTEEKHGLTVELKLDREAEPCAEDIRILLFQSVRELLFNVIKHAEVQRACVAMSSGEGHRVQVVVSDEGAGIDRARLQDDGTCIRGFGLFSIRERLELLGGSMKVESTPGRGTRVTILAPQPDAASARDALRRRPRRMLILGESVDANRWQNDSGKIRVLLADDHQVLREGLTRLLEEQGDIEVVAEAADGETAVAKALRTTPDVVLMDVTMPEIDGVEATRRITAALPWVRVIALSMHEKEDMAEAMYEAGAVAYLSKGGPWDLLLAAVRGQESGIRG